MQWELSWMVVLESKIKDEGIVPNRGISAAERQNLTAYGIIFNVHPIYIKSLLLLGYHLHCISSNRITLPFCVYLQ